MYPKIAFGSSAHNNITLPLNTYYVFKGSAENQRKGPAVVTLGSSATLYVHNYVICTSYVAQKMLVQFCTTRLPAKRKGNCIGASGIWNDNSRAANMQNLLSERSATDWLVPISWPAGEASDGWKHYAKISMGVLVTLPN